jgi:hypothetical protein
VLLRKREIILNCKASLHELTLEENVYGRGVLEWRSIYVLRIELRDWTEYRMTCFVGYVETADSRKGDLKSITCKFTLIILGNSVAVSSTLL